MTHILELVSLLAVGLLLWRFAMAYRGGPLRHGLGIPHDPAGCSYCVREHRDARVDAYIRELLGGDP